MLLHHKCHPVKQRVNEKDHSIKLFFSCFEHAVEHISLKVDLKKIPPLLACDLDWGAHSVTTGFPHFAVPLLFLLPTIHHRSKNRKAVSSSLCKLEHLTHYTDNIVYLTYRTLSDVIK